MGNQIKGFEHKTRKYKALLISNAPFLKAGNQSFRRTVEGVISRGLIVELWLLGNYKHIPILNFSSDEFSIKNFSSRFISILAEIVNNMKIRLIKKLVRKILKTSFLANVSSDLNYNPQEVVEFRNDFNQWGKGIPFLLIYFLRVILFTFYNYRNLKRDIDIIWGYERSGVIIGYILSKILRKPLISSFQGTVLYYYLTKYGKLNTFLKLPIDFVSLKLRSELKIITNDGTHGDMVVKMLGDYKSPIIHVPNGVDYNFLVEKVYKPRKLSKKILGLKDNDILAITAYRLDRWKRIDRSIYLVSYLVKKGFSDIYLYIIGDGPERLYLQKLIKSLDIEENVRILGAISYEETLDYILASDVVFSFCDHSNLTNTVQDALFLGKWIFVLDDGSIDELKNYFDLTKVIKISKNGFIVEGVNKFLDWIKEYKRDDESLNFRPQKFWTWDNRMDLICDIIYKEIINKSI